MHKKLTQLVGLGIISFSLGAGNPPQTPSAAAVHVTPLDAHIPVRDLQHIVLGYLQHGWDWALKTVIRVPNNPLLITYLLEQNYLACASKNGSISFYDLVTHKISKTIRYAAGAAAQAQAKPHHLHALVPLAPSYLACSGDQGIKIWHTADITNIGKPIISLVRRMKQQSHLEVSSLAYNPKQQLLASSLPSEKIHIWMLGNKKSAMQRVQMRCVPGEARELAFSPDGRHLASGGLSNHAVSIWDTKTGTRVQTIILTDIPRLFVSVITSISWLAGARIIAGIHNHLCIWDLSDIKKPIQERIISDADVLAQIHQLVPVERSTNTVALVNDVSKKRIAVYNRMSGLRQNVFEFHDGSINQIALSPDGAYCAAACTDQTIKIWQNTAHALFALYNKEEYGTKI